MNLGEADVVFQFVLPRFDNPARYITVNPMDENSS